MKLSTLTPINLNSMFQMDAQLPVGTPEYIAPEVLLSLNEKADYGTCCDWWSLGIIAYELLYEATPFEGGTTSKTYNNIMTFQVNIPFVWLS